MIKFLVFKDCSEGEDGAVTILYKVIKRTKHEMVVDEIMSGDWYHDKIDERIEGFFEGLNFAKVKYEVEYQEIWERDEQE